MNNKNFLNNNSKSFYNFSIKFIEEYEQYKLNKVFNEMITPIILKLSVDVILTRMKIKSVEKAFENCKSVGNTSSCLKRIILNKKPFECDKAAIRCMGRISKEEVVKITEAIKICKRIDNYNKKSNCLKKTTKLLQYHRIILALNKKYEK